MESLVPAIRAVVKKDASALAIGNLRSMRDQIGISLTMERLVSVLCTAFGLIATILAGIGLYGIMAFHVARRTKETGIGMALGVQRSGVHRLILKEAGILAITGVAAGIPFALTLSHYSMSRLFQIEPTNPTAYTGAALFLPTIALTATRLPARRTDPISSSPLENFQVFRKVAWRRGREPLASASGIFAITFFPKVL